MADSHIVARPFRLLDLPPELVGQIYKHLDDEALRHARQICSALCTQSTTAFGQRFFHHLIVVLHPISLTLFLEIARHPELSKFVRRVSVSGEQIGPSMTAVEDQQIHEDLQRSLERSGLDAIILEEAFAALTNMEIVRIDTEQFFCGANTTNHHLGIQCGRTQMLKHEFPAFSWDAPQSNHGYSRVYILVLEVLEKCQMYARVDLELSFWAAFGGGSKAVVPKYFDAQSSLWKSHAASRLKYLHSMGQVNPKWIYALLQSVPDLCRLELSFPEISTTNAMHTRLFYGFVDNFHWPNLSRIRLEELTTPYAPFLNFLVTHQDTLLRIWFSMIGFSGGTWSEPLAVISRMPKLEAIFLQVLLEREAYSSPSFPEDIPDHGGKHIDVEDRGDVVCTMVALCGPMATRPNRYNDVEGREGEFYPFEVDLSLGIMATREWISSPEWSSLSPESISSSQELEEP